MAPIAKKACGTCRDRKILCDRAGPTCLNCRGSGRKCKGYTLMRVSWPREGDAKRSIRAAPRRMCLRRSAEDVYLVNTSSRDVELHRYLTSDVLDTRPPPEGLFVSRSMSWLPFRMKTAEVDLISYFDCIAADSLATLSHGGERMGSILLRLALSNASSATAAVLASLLAVSSLHRHGPGQESSRLKMAAIRRLVTSSSETMDESTAIQHVAAGMLLCSFEQFAEGTSRWLLYICGAITIVNTAGLDATKGNEDIAAVAGWVYYHEVLARFSRWYWHDCNGLMKRFVKDLSIEPGTPVPDRKDIRTQFPGSAGYEIIRLISEVADAVRDPSDPEFTSDEYRETMHSLEAQVRGIHIEPCSGQGGKIRELFQLALLTYLERVSLNVSGDSAQISDYKQRAFTIMESLDSCERGFPLFILGCEAREDEQRMTIMRLLGHSKARHLDVTREMIQGLWAQDDLGFGLQEVGYMDKLKAVMASHHALPTLA